MDHFKHSSVENKLGEMIIIAGDDGNAYRYDLTTWQLRQTYDISSLDAFSSTTGSRILIAPDFTWFAIGMGPSMVVIDMEDGSELFSDASFGGYIDMDSAGTRICILNNSQVKLVNTSTWIAGSAQNHLCSLYAGCKFSPDDTYIAIGGYNNNISAWTWSDTTLTKVSGVLSSKGWYCNNLAWYSDNNIIFIQSPNISGGADEQAAYRRSTNTILSSTNSGKSTKDFFLTDYGLGYTSSKGYGSTYYGNPNASNESLKYVTAYNGALVTGAYTADGASYPNPAEYVISMCLSVDLTRGFYSGRRTSTECNLHEFNPSDMNYVGKHVTDIGESAEQFFFAMACFNPDL